MEIKKAKISDLKEIQNLNLMLFEKEQKECDKLLNCKWTFSEDGLKYFKDKLQKENSCALIAIEEGKVIGYLVGGLIKGESYRNLPKMAELDNMLVLEEYRNLKVGTKLYDEFLKWCKSKGVKRIKVQASAQNERAINFYRKNGFKDYSITLEHELN